MAWPCRYTVFVDAFLLVRHARTRLDPALLSAQWCLADDAVSDCRRLAAKLASAQPTEVITSSEPKAIATGSLLAESWAVPCSETKGLEEHDRSGVPFVHDNAACLATLETLFKEPDLRVLGRESASEALYRFESALRRELDARPPGQTPALVSHATVMSLFVAKHNALDAFRFWQTLRMPEGLLLRRADFSLVARYGVN
jgi:broad specificity phosphatase PhoE